MIGEKWTKIDEENKSMLEKMKEEGKIYRDLTKGNRAVTLNMLIDICKEEKIDFDKPILLECCNGYFPLAYTHNAIGYTEEGEEYKLNLLAITDWIYQTE